MRPGQSRHQPATRVRATEIDAARRDGADDALTEGQVLEVPSAYGIALDQKGEEEANFAKDAVPCSGTRTVSWAAERQKRGTPTAEPSFFPNVRSLFSPSLPKLLTLSAILKR